MKLLLIVVTLFATSWCNGAPTNEKFFFKFGEYEFINEKGQTAVKSYHSFRERALNWLQAFQTCRSFGMDLVELPTKAEHDYFLALCQQHESQLVGSDYAIGASCVGAGIHEFYWMTTGQRVNYSLKFAPGEPNNLGGTEEYLNIFKSPEQFMFKDVSPVLMVDFICQRINYTNSKPDVDPNLPNWPKCDQAIVEWFPHPYSCEKFILCFHGNPIVKTCASKLRFNAKEGKCISSQLPCCPYVDDVMNPLFVADKDDCSKYYICFSGKAIERTCGEGLFFDVTSSLCTFSKNVTCIDVRL